MLRAREILITFAGHRQAYLSGQIHRDISIGNVMMERKDDGTVSGFIHDFDYAFSWKDFLATAGLPVELETWERYVREEYRRVTQRRKEAVYGDGQSDVTRSHSETAPQSEKDGSPKPKKESVASEFHVDAAMQKELKSKAVR